MTKNTDMINLERLINTGKDKGYITYEELNDDLSDEIVSSEEHIDDLMMMFEELDIMVIDEASKGEIEKAKRSKKKKAEPQEKENHRSDIPDTSTRVSDPVKMYLREMGCISLLTREGEVAIAKRIEAGQKKALSALLDCCVGIEHIIESVYRNECFLDIFPCLYKSIYRCNNASHQNGESHQFTNTECSLNDLIRTVPENEGRTYGSYKITEGMKVHSGIVQFKIDI